MNFELDQETKAKIAKLGKCKEQLPAEELNGKYKKALTQLKQEIADEITLSLKAQCRVYLGFIRNPSKEEIDVIQRIADVYCKKISDAAFKQCDFNSVEKLGGLFYVTLATRAKGLIAQKQIHM